MTRVRKLEIGPELKHVSKGRPPPRIGPEWELLDAEKKLGIDHVAVWGQEPLPLPDQSFVHVYASHCLEHVWYYQTVDALREVYRVLVPGGICEMWVPDFGKVVECYIAKKMGDGWKRNNPDADWSLWVQGRIFAYGDGKGGGDTTNLHRACFDEEMLKDRMAKAGFVDLRRLKKPTGKDNHGYINLGVAGIRPK